MAKRKPQPAKPVKAWGIVLRDGSLFWETFKTQADAASYVWASGERIARVEIREVSK